jgi:hypothetical protein
MSKKSKRQAAPSATAKKIGIFVATPTLDGRLHAGSIASIMGVQRMCIENGVGFTWKVISGNSILPLARNELASGFLESKATHLFMIDSDIQVDPRHVMYLLGHDRDISALPCAKREVTWERLNQFVTSYPSTPHEVYPALIAEGNFNTTEDVFNVDQDGFAKVLKVGTGAMMVKRATLDKIMRERPDDYIIKPSGEKLYEFFSYTVDPETKIQYGEDYTFCNKWRSLGGTIDLLLAAKTKHHGQIAIEFDWKALAVAISEQNELKG